LITATDLAAMVVRAARAVTLTVTDPDSPGGGRAIRFSTQTDSQPLQPTKDTGPGAPLRSTGRSVATYLAKYVTKSVAEFGVGIRRMSPLAVTELEVTAHVRAILTTVTAMAAQRAYRAAWTRQRHAEHAATPTDAQRWATPPSRCDRMGIRPGRAVHSRRACPDPVGGTADDRTPPHRPR
jgi:Replication initiator protein, pSAM2